MVVEFRQKRSFERHPYDEAFEFTVLFTEAKNLIKVSSGGKIINASPAGIGIITEYPLEPGHVLEWDDKHKKGSLHLASVRWSQKFDDYYRAGLMFI